MTEPSKTTDPLEVRDSIRRALGDWRRFIVAVDGVDAAGKSTLARYLAWQVGMPAIETDLFLVRDSGGLTYHWKDLGRLLKHRLSRDRPLIIEGVCMLHLLDMLDVGHDFLVWVERQDNEGSRFFEETFSAYRDHFQPQERADITFTWSSD